MREIKFRAWHRKKKAWHFFRMPFDMFKADFWDDEGKIEPSGLDYEHWCESTGLRDRNGKEIFEGDVLRCVGGLYRVVWGKESASFLALGVDIDDGLTLGSACLGRVEVAGNIHEHPNLLEPPDA